jgi:hypothetical protein
MGFRWLSACIGLLLLAVAGRAQQPADGVEFFEAKIRPVLVKHCYSCHSAEAKKPKGGLLLDSRAGVLRGGESGPAIVPGKPGASLLLRAVRHDDPELKMPPSGKLPDAVIADLERWIAMKAPDPRDRPASAGKAADKIQEAARKHWAFQPLRRPTPPAVKHKDWPTNAIDAFVLARLEAAGLAPAPRADRYTLLRRVHFDLTGLPPTPEEIEAFAKEDRPAAYSALVEQLLSSPHHGERWARHWLDVARYADSAGYELDTVYDFAWHYRDYVIRALNADRPMNRFITEQVAGDEMFPDSEDAQVATGFCTVGPYPYEGGIQRTHLVEYQRLTDIADTIGSAFLGLTVGCARCHDHKYDPISQRDYFGLQAVFASSEFKDEKLGPSRSKERLVARVLQNRKEATKIHLLRRGELDAPQDEAAPSLIRWLPGGGPLNIPATEPKGRRSALARWLTAPDNPLTARVLANRVWQWHFGKALVRTPNDFGAQGEPPTHPELLDYLASELISSGWSLRHLHRVILASSTYRMSSRREPRAAQLDPEYRLLSRFPRRRLEAEILWDHLHSAAGTLNRKQFGPAVVPPVDPEALKGLLNANWKVTPDKSEWSRRGIYLAVRRSLQFPLFDTFNAARGLESSAGRENTIVTSQALTLLNDPTVVEQARELASRLLREQPKQDRARIERAWLLLFSRPASAAEVERTLDFLHRREAALAKSSEPPPLLPRNVPAEVPAAKAGAVAEWCLALVNTNEFLYVD